MLISIVLFEVGSGIAGAAHSLAVILVGRLIQGIGGGGVPLAAELIVSDVVPLPERPQMLGLVRLWLLLVSVCCWVQSWGV